MNAQFLNTLKLDSLAVSPQVDISKLNWIAGCWEGEAFGGKTEEVWNPASGGSMMGMFKLYDEGGIVFYELMTIAQKEESLILRIKHFGRELEGWEEKNESVEFPLVKVEENYAFFSGLTFEKISEDLMNVYVLIGHGDGAEEEVKFAYNSCKY